MKYKVNYTQGNGYTCGCCRREYLSFETFDNINDANYFIHEMKIISNDHTLSRFEDEWDRDFINLDIIEDNVDNFHYKEDLLKKIELKLIKEKNLKLKKEENERKTKQEESDKKLLKELKDKYEN